MYKEFIMNNTLNGKFTRVELTGTTKKEALDKAPFSIMGDATQAWKLWLAKQDQEKMTEDDVKEFMIAYLQKKSKLVPGVGYYITRKPAVVDSRQRPYSIKNVKNELGRRKYKTIYRWVDDATGKVVVEVDTTKAKAEAALKDMYTKKGYKGNATLILLKKVSEGQEIAAKAKYTPSVNAQLGEYIAFGVEK
jgi:hypothetical protein